MPIKETDESENDRVDDDNNVEVQLSSELEATVELIRSTRTRQLPLRYRE